MPAQQKMRRPRGRPPSSSAEHRRVAAALKAQIASGTWQHLELLPTVRELAQTHRASVCAVRLALEQLCGERLVARNARRRRMFLSKRSFSMDGHGIVLEVRSTPLAVANNAASAESELQRGILAGCGECHVPLLIAHTHELQDTQPTGFLDLPLKAILLVGHFTDKNLRAYERLSVPVCMVDTPTDRPRLHSVCVDNAAATYDATKRLFDAGHRRIAFIQFILYTLRCVDPDSKERKSGFLTACAEAGISKPTDHVYSYLPGRDAQYSMQAMLKARPRFTAAVCVDPSCAAALAKEARNLAIKIPQDLGIVCFQGLTDAVPYSGPACDFFDLGRRAVHVTENPGAAPVRERVSTVWRERGSLRPL